jgi:GntR family transcriptional regulator
MYIEINPASGIPIYLQIKKQIKNMLATGMLKPNDAMPSVRHLAIELRVNPNTIAKAYRELELEGILYTKRGTGVFVSDKTTTIQKLEKDEKINRLANILDHLLVEAYHLGINNEELTQLLQTRFEKYKEKLL